MATDRLLCVWLTFPVEDKSGTTASQRLVRRRGNDVGVLEGRGHDPGHHQAADVRHVGHQVRPVLVRYPPQAGVVKVTGVAAGACTARERKLTEKKSYKLCFDCIPLDFPFPQGNFPKIIIWQFPYGHVWHY